MPITSLQCGDRSAHGAHSWRPPDSTLFERFLCPGWIARPPDDPAWPLSKRPRWCYGGRRSYGWAQCRFCGAASASDCAPALCPLCGSVQCKSQAQCKICHHGALDGFWRPDGRDRCGYTGCEEPVIAERLPRVNRACAGHLARVKLRYGGGSVPLTEYVQARVAHRDSGQGWEKWRLVA